MSDLFGDVCPCCGQPMPEPEYQATLFDEFWVKWPDKRAKIPAVRAWEKLSSAEKKVAFDRCEAWCQEWREKNREASHIMAATYLNQRRFLDEPKGSKVSPETQAAAEQQLVQAIRSGKDYLCRTITPARARGLVRDGYVSEEECRKAGVL